MSLEENGTNRSCCFEGRSLHAVYLHTARGNEEFEAQMNDTPVEKPPHRGVWRRRRFRKVLMLDAYLSNRIR